MQHIDRVAHLQPLAQPSRTRRPRMESQSLRLVTGAQSLDRIRREGRRPRDIGQEPAVRPSEP